MQQWHALDWCLGEPGRHLRHAGHRRPLAVARPWPQLVPADPLRAEQLPGPRRRGRSRRPAARPLQHGRQLRLQPALPGPLRLDRRRHELRAAHRRRRDRQPPRHPLGHGLCPVQHRGAPGGEVAGHRRRPATRTATAMVPIVASTDGWATWTQRGTWNQASFGASSLDGRATGRDEGRFYVACGQGLVRITNAFSGTLSFTKLSGQGGLPDGGVAGKPYVSADGQTIIVGTGGGIYRSDERRVELEPGGPRERLRQAAGEPLRPEPHDPDLRPAEHVSSGRNTPPTAARASPRPPTPTSSGARASATRR